MILAPCGPLGAVQACLCLRGKRTVRVVVQECLKRFAFAALIAEASVGLCQTPSGFFRKGPSRLQGEGALK
ncbi:MAG: hypothetical protein SF187_05885 [Deltaproteobacteria bacterium]|nr:hypothetical protein [Deltaproteobacteria bacterium]